MTRELLYSLTPRLYRNRDLPLGEPLRAYLLVIQQQFDRVARNFADTYDNWFIETCAPWVIPHIADLIGAGGATQAARARALVASTIDDRRGKGTPLALQNALADCVDTPARISEGIAVTAFTQNVRVVDPARGRLVDVRAERELLWLETPFSRLARTVELRTPMPAVDRAPRPGEVAARPDAVTLYLWRLASYPIEGGEPGRCGDERYTFDPSRRSVPLFRPAPDELTTGAPRGPSAYPGPIRRAELACALADSSPPPLGFAVFV
jgi:hypothetical protein